jgi:hypothetical protein
LQKTRILPPRNAEYTEIRRKEFYSAAFGGFSEVWRIIPASLVAVAAKVLGGSSALGLMQVNVRRIV